MIGIYLAARFGRRDELVEYSRLLFDRGYLTTSRWLTQHQKIDLHAKDASYTERQRMEFAIHDYEDVLRAQRIIAFTEDPRENAPGGRRGGRHVELGIALAAGKHIYVVGHRENVFCHLPQVMFFDNFYLLLETL